MGLLNKMKAVLHKFITYIEDKVEETPVSKGKKSFVTTGLKKYHANPWSLKCQYLNQVMSYMNTCLIIDRKHDYGIYYSSSMVVFNDNTLNDLHITLNGGKAQLHKF